MLKNSLTSRIWEIFTGEWDVDGASKLCEEVFSIPADLMITTSYIAKTGAFT